MLNIDSMILSRKDIRSKRAEVAERFIAASPNVKSQTIARISASDLRLLFELYDAVFFHHRFLAGYQGKLKFSLSPRLTKSAGKTLCPRNIAQLKPEEVVIEIRMGLGFFFDYDQVKGEKTVNGIPTRSALEALQLVFEHELCHVIEFIRFHSSNCSRERFKTIARNLFGHSESYHKLPTQRQIAQVKYGLKLGDTVSFTYGNKKLQGLLYKINKRAIVMVKDENGYYADRQGNRYSKYYVPIELLKKPQTTTPA